MDLMLAGEAVFYIEIRFDSSMGNFYTLLFTPSPPVLQEPASYLDLCWPAKKKQMAWQPDGWDGNVVTKYVAVTKYGLQSPTTFQKTCRCPLRNTSGLSCFQPFPSDVGINGLITMDHIP